MTVEVLPRVLPSEAESEGVPARGELFPGVGGSACGPLAFDGRVSRGGASACTGSAAALLATDLMLGRLSGFIDVFTGGCNNKCI